MAGTIPISMTQQFGDDDMPLAGGKLYLIQAGTVSTPQNGFQDSALTLPWPNPIILSASGRIPQFFLADGSIKIRLTDANGVAVAGMTVDGLIVTGASSGGGGGSPVDATTVLATGDIKARYGVGVLTGFVRCNARTIGSATSGASERANSDTQALFEYLWNTDVNLVVSSGRGATSIADWSANKTIALPDFRSRALAGLGDMGNSDNALFSGVTFTSGNSTTLGSLLGAARRTLGLTQLPTGITATNLGLVAASLVSADAVVKNGTFQSAVGGGTQSTVTGGTFGTTISSGNIGIGAIVTTSNNTGGLAHDTVSTYGLITIYQKL